MHSAFLLHPLFFCMVMLLTFMKCAVAEVRPPLQSRKSRPKEVLTNNPIIGIFAQPSQDAHPACDRSCDYIAASYVKWIEGAGGMYYQTHISFPTF